MSTFSATEYQNTVNAAQNRNQNVKVGFFKLANDGDEALVRVNVSTLDDLHFASVHTVSTGGKWLKISCLKPVGSFTDDCELCTAADSGNSAISKASKRVYIEMLVSYKDSTTGQWSAPIPAVWDRPAGFYREIANKLRDYGDLKQTLLKITRNGKAGDMKTTYSIDYAVPAVFRPEMVPADFSAFNNFKIEKHSFWEKTAEEIHTFLTTGAFPEIARVDAPTTVDQVAQTYTQATYQAPVQPVYQAPATPETKPQEPSPQRTFNGFSF